MKKVVITLTSDKDLFEINKSMNILIETMLKHGTTIKEYTIQEAK